MMLKSTGMRALTGRAVAGRVPAVAPAPLRCRSSALTRAAAEGAGEKDTTNHAASSPTAEPTPAASPATPAPSPPPPPPPAPSTQFYGIPDSAFENTAADIKAALLDSLFGTERGLATNNETRAEINELISQLEAKNPTPSPTEMMQQLDGEWRLIYTSSSPLISILALSRLPLVKVGDIFQKIDSTTQTVENKIQLSGPLSKTEVTATANYEVKSPKRLQLRLTEGKVATPEITGDIDIPNSVSVLGQYVDLSQLKEAVTPLKSQAEGLISQLNQLVGQVPGLSVPLSGLPLDDAQTWSLTTYVDDNLRVARGDGGGVFIYSRV